MIHLLFSLTTEQIVFQRNELNNAHNAALESEPCVFVLTEEETNQDHVTA